jgi:erythronate-4-phosphate dehydrogenase
MVLDVWEGEPLFRDEVAEKAFISTPHIAGYSKESKERASRMVVEQMGQFFGLEIRVMDEMRGDGAVASREKPNRFSMAEQIWIESNIDHYDRELRKLIGVEDHEKGRLFAKLRSETELRSEW